MVAVGDKIPDITLKAITPDGTVDVSTGDLFASGTTVLFGVPGAFTPVCTDFHLPGFVLKADDLKARGVDRIACLSVNDAFVMGAWGKAEGADGEGILMLADDAAAFTTAMGLDTDASSFGLGTRSERYAAVIRDGALVSLGVEKAFTDHEVSTADAVLATL